MINKTIHYIWLSVDKFPESLYLIHEEYKRVLPEYKLRLWNSSDYEAIPNKPQYIIDAYNKKKWAFVSDYIRIYALYTEGGWYCDTDLQIFRNDLDKYSSHRVVSAMEVDGKKYEEYKKTKHGNPGIQIQAAFIGGEAGHPFFKDLLDYYNTIEFDYQNDKTIIAPVIYANVAKKYGFTYDNKEKILDDDILLLSADKVLAHRVYLKDIDIPFAVHHCFHGWIDNPWNVETEYVNYFKTLHKDRWIIQSFWTKPMLIEGKNIEEQINLAELSLLFAQRSGFKVKMYTDTFGYKLLKDKGYNEISTLLDNIPNSISYHLFAAGKAWALRDAGIGVVHIDYDVFIKKPCCIIDFYEDKNIDIILQNEEPYQKWYKNLSKTFTEISNIKNFDPYYKGIANTGIIGFNNKELMDKYLNNYFDCIFSFAAEKLLEYKYNKLDFLLEQVAVHYFSNDYVRRYVVYDFDEANWMGYQHLQGDEKNKPEIKSLIKQFIYKFKIYNERKKIIFK